MIGVAVFYGTMTTTPQGTQQMRSLQYGSPSDRTGKFYFSGISPGHYSAFVRATLGGPAGYSDPVDFDVTDSKVTNLVVRVRAGATVRGMVVLNDPNDQAAAAALGITGLSQSDRQFYALGGVPVRSTVMVVSDQRRAAEEGSNLYFQP
jgi:hypothetical protein